MTYRAFKQLAIFDWVLRLSRVIKNSVFHRQKTLCSVVRTFAACNMPTQNIHSSKKLKKQRRAQQKTTFFTVVTFRVISAWHALDVSGPILNGGHGRCRQTVVCGDIVLKKAQFGFRTSHSEGPPSSVAETSPGNPIQPIAHFEKDVWLVSDATLSHASAKKCAASRTSIFMLSRPFLCFLPRRKQTRRPLEQCFHTPDSSCVEWSKTARSDQCQINNLYVVQVCHIFISWLTPFPSLPTYLQDIPCLRLKQHKPIFTYHFRVQRRQELEQLACHPRLCVWLVGAWQKRIALKAP